MIEKVTGALKKVETASRVIAAASFATQLMTEINTSVITQNSAVFGVTTFIARKIIDILK